MKWSKIRKELLDRLAVNLKDRLDYHFTTYKNSTGFIGRAWITLDGIELVNFSNSETLNEFDSMSNSTVGTHYKSHPPIDDHNRTDGKIIERGEFSKYDFGETAWQFINSDIDAALNSENAILRSLAVVDRRVGSRRLEILKATERHPLVLKFIELRENSIK